MNQADLKRSIARRLALVRQRTLDLISHVPEEFWRQRIHSFYSPIGWHFGHVGRTEEYWTCQVALGRPATDDALTFLFHDCPENPKDNRVKIPGQEAVVEYLAETTKRTLDALEVADLSDPGRLLNAGYAWEFALRHECQHQETIVEMLCLIHQSVPEPITAPGEAPAWADQEPADLVEIPGGWFRMGSSDPYAYDNEKQPHDVRVEAFSLDQRAASVADWVRFIEDGGYRRPELWSTVGWIWRCAHDVDRPEYWLSLGDRPRAFGPLGVRTLGPDEPVAAISYFEAEAYARWRGLRLPTEVEWEFAASAGTYPWGDEVPDQSRANFGLHTLHPTAPPAGGASPEGVLGLAGGSWEWTSSRFLPYPGYEPYPYDGYSKDHMKGEHFVCRGGSWATAAPILVRTFRNWYVPSYRQGFLGVRCAR